MKIFGSKQGVLRLHRSETGTCLWRQHACSRSQTKWHWFAGSLAGKSSLKGRVAAPLPALWLQALNLASKKQQKKQPSKRRGMFGGFRRKTLVLKDHTVAEFLSLHHMWDTFTVSLFGGFLKWWYPTTMGFPTKNDDFGV